jgi:tripartite-type tricarboxylate transporter receptor subunit TctC
MNRFFTCLLSVSIATLLAPQAQTYAQAWPERPIRLVVGFPPGGSGDFIARNMTEDLTRLLGQQIIVDNRPGAGSNIAAEIVARANPDGYSVLLGGSFSHAANPTLYKRLPFDPQKDFSPITKLANFTTIIARLEIETSECPQQFAAFIAREIPF